MKFSTENFFLKRKTALFSVFFIHTAILVFAVLFLMISGKDYADYLLRDDGYYKIAARFLGGNFCAGYGPGLPLIFSPIHLFPEVFHPFVRILISQAAVFFILFFLSRITKDILTNRQFFWGALLVVIHPAFLHWSIRTSIDLYLAVMLSGFILFFLKYFEHRKISYFLIALLFYGYGIFTRPSFILIPIILLLLTLFYKKFRVLVLPVIVLTIFSFVAFYINNLYIQHCRKGTLELTADTGRSVVIFQGFMLTETILKTKQFHKGSVDKYNLENIETMNLTDRNEFMEKYSTGSTFSLMGEYFREKPGYFIAKFLLAPVFYFSLSSRESESYFLLFVTMLFFIVSILGLKKIFAQSAQKRQLIFILFILLGYAGLHWLTHSYSRYSLPVIPFLFVWSGVTIEHWLNRIQRKRKNVHLHP
jgi:hypothetical protein